VACECCISADEKSTLLTTPLRELTDGQLGEYASSVFHTMGEVPDFKYFLPRIFELAVRDEFHWPSPEVVTSKLSLAHWLDWPAEEQVAVSDLLQAKFGTLVNDANSVGSDIDQWICALGRCLPDPTPFLKPLLQPQHEDKLLAFIGNGSIFTKNKLDSHFGEDAPENEKRVIAWLSNRATAKLERYGWFSRRPTTDASGGSAFLK
jgi:hypothetical protein